MNPTPDEARRERRAARLRAGSEVIGFAAVVAAAFTVSLGLGLLALGLGLILAANQPRSRPPRVRGRR